MHASSYENMERCYHLYVAGNEIETRSPLKVLDIGVRLGKSLALADCPAVGVDPMADI